MKRLSSVLLILGLCIITASTMWGQFSVTIHATDGVNTDSLVIGTFTGATFGVDTVGPAAVKGEVEQPPIPQTGAFDIRSVDFGTHAQTHGAGIKIDFRSYVRPSQSDSFYVLFQVGDTNTTHDSLDLSWRSGLSGVGGGYWKLVDLYGGLYVNVNMTTQTSVRVPAELGNGNTPGTGFYIIHGDSTSYTTVSYYRVRTETDDKGKWGKATKGNKKAPWIGPNLHFLASQLDKNSTLKASGLMIVGSDAIKSVVVKKYADVLKSGWDAKTLAYHLPTNLTCLDSMYNSKFKAIKGDATKTPRPVPVTKQLKDMVPTAAKSAQNNGLFAEIMVAKLNIALCDYGVFPPYAVATGAYPSIENLLITDASLTGTFHKYNGKTVAQLVSDADHYFSCDSSHALVAGVTLSELRTMLEKFNKAFTKTANDTGFYTTSLAKFDTTNYWSSFPKSVKLVSPVTVKGNRPISDVGFLSRGASAEAGSGNVSNLLANANHPKQYTLEQNYPNPFNPTTQITFNLIDKGFVTVKVYNMLGQEVATLANHEEMATGEQALEFDAANYASGVYFYRIAVNDEAGALKFQSTKKMMLVK